MMICFGRCLDDLYDTGLSEVFQQISGQVVSEQYAGVKQRLFLISSQAAYEREVITLTRCFAKESEQECRKAQKTLREEYSCLSDAQRAPDELIA
jgi:hypothetical protein